MSARDDYPSPRDQRIGFQQYLAMCDEIDHLRAKNAELSDWLRDLHEHPESLTT